MQLLKILFAAASITSINSCQKEVADPTPSVSAMVRNNVSYGADARQTFDMDLPASRTKDTKVMILIHGGAWNTGDKADLSAFVDSFKKRQPSYAYFNINYRLATNSSTLFPTQENDVQAAIQFIYDHADEYIISKKFVLVGVSAGAQLALLQSYKQANPVRPKAVVSFFGPTDMADMYNNPANPLVPGGLLSVIGKTPTQDSLIYANSSPINYVSAVSPPTLILHGGLDQLVKPSQSVRLQQKLQAAGVINQYVFYPNEAHGWFGATLSDSFDKMQAFILANVP